MMKMYALSLGVGLLVGVLYYLLNVKSPAPPFVALVGLLGMVLLFWHELDFSAWHVGQLTGMALAALGTSQSMAKLNHELSPSPLPCAAGRHRYQNQRLKNLS